MPRHLPWRAPILLALGGLLALTAVRGLAQEGPSIVITAPGAGEVLPGPDITVSVAVSGFTMSVPLEPAQEPNRGHIEYFLDAEPFFDQPVPLGEDNIIHSGRPGETFLGVTDGEHTIYVCLAYDDHTCIDPALTDSVQVSVGQSPATATPPPQATPTPQQPPETPHPPPPTATQTQEPAATETAVPKRTPTVSPTPQESGLFAAGAATPTPVRPSPTAGPPTPTATPAFGISPATTTDQAAGDNFAWLYIAVGAGSAVLVAGGAASAWRARRLRNRR